MFDGEKISARTLLLAVVLTMGAGAAWSQDALSPAKGDANAGLIFSFDSTTLGLTSYNGGFGLKYGAGAWAVRGLLELSLSSSVIQSTAGLAYEFHLNTGRISPYLGADLNVGFIDFILGTTSSIVMPVHAGGFVGVEVFPLEFLSLFAEYELGADLQVIFGPPLTVNYLASIGMGNGAKVGIVVWFSRMRSK